MTATAGTSGSAADTAVATQEGLPTSWRPAVRAIGCAVAALGVLGFVNSFARVQAAARPHFGRLAWTLPTGVDLGIAVFAAADIVLAKAGMRPRWVRLVAPALTGATVYLNIAGESTWFGKVAHAVLPGLWVAAIEVGSFVIRRRAKLARTAATRMDRIRVSRWLLAPVATLLLWRRMVLWEERSYPAALRLEMARVLALTRLQDEYGRLAWHWRAPRRERALYKLGQFTPTAPAEASADNAKNREQQPPADEQPRVKPARRRPPHHTPSKPSAERPATDVEELMPLGWRIAADLEAQGLALTRDRLVEAMRKAGTPIHTTKAGTLLARLKAEAPADPAEQADVHDGDHDDKHREVA